MKLYRRDLKILPLDEMHLEVDHYLTPIEITEEEIYDIIVANLTTKIDLAKALQAAKAILSKFKGE